VRRRVRRDTSAKWRSALVARQLPAVTVRSNRWLGVGSAKEAGISVLVNQGDEFFDCRNFRRCLISVPLRNPALPEASPPAPRSDLRGLRERLFLSLSRRAAPDRPAFKEFHTLARNAKAEVQLRPDMGRRPAALHEATDGLPNSRCFKFAERHRNRLLTVKLSSRPTPPNRRRKRRLSCGARAA